ncbi:MAG: hypothetical protein E7411_00105 [Ruminococcaceae bacterium]|nr:hypothetical protein [Oscillospiraceae bacterium]
MNIGQRIYTRFDNGYDSSDNGSKLSSKSVALWEKIRQGISGADYGYSLYNENGVCVYSVYDRASFDAATGKNIGQRETTMFHSYILEDVDSKWLGDNIDRIFSITDFMKNYTSTYPVLDKAAFEGLKPFEGNGEAEALINYEVLSALTLKAILENKTLKIKCSGAYGLKKDIILHLYKCLPDFLKGLLSFSTYKTGYYVPVLFVKNLEYSDSLYYDCDADTYSVVDTEVAMRLKHIRENEPVYKKEIEKTVGKGFCTRDALLKAFEKLDFLSAESKLSVDDKIKILIRLIDNGGYKDPDYCDRLINWGDEIDRAGRLPEIYNSVNSLYGRLEQMSADESRKIIKFSSAYFSKIADNCKRSGYDTLSEYPFLFENVARHAFSKDGDVGSFDNAIGLCRAVFEKKYKQFYSDSIRLIITELKSVNIGDNGVKIGIYKLLDCIFRNAPEYSPLAEKTFSAEAPMPVKEYYKDFRLSNAETPLEIIDVKNAFRSLFSDDGIDFYKAAAEKYAQLQYDAFCMGGELTAIECRNSVFEFLSGTGISFYELDAAHPVLRSVFSELGDPLSWDEDRWSYIFNDQSFYKIYTSSNAIEPGYIDIVKLATDIRNKIPLKASDIDYVKLLLPNDKKGKKASKNTFPEFFLKFAGKYGDFGDPDLKYLVMFLNGDLRKTDCLNENFDVLCEYIEGAIEGGYSPVISHPAVFKEFFAYVNKGKNKESDKEKIKKYKAIIEKLYSYGVQTVYGASDGIEKISLKKKIKRDIDVYKLENIMTSALKGRVVSFMFIFVFMLISAFVQFMSKGQLVYFKRYIAGCADTASFMLGLFTLAAVYLNGKGSDAKRKIDAGINLTVFILFWVIFRIILSFVL